MANDKKISFYEVLGVEKTADERAIKKAYFGLVRKFPPETHPEEFKKIREAYEVLSNAQSRADYDSIDKYDQYGEEISTRIKAGMEAMDAGDYRTAQREFIEVLRLQPQLHFARDLLGMAYLNNDQPEEALGQFDALIQAQPDNHVYQLHKGYAHYHQKQYEPAMAAFRAAAKMDESDTRVLVAMADCLSAQKQYEAALAELDRAINMDGQVDFQDFVFFMRKVQIQLLRNRADLAETDLDQIFKILPDDPDTKKYVATRLASLAADLFAMKRSVDANRLLQRCRQLDPSRKSMEFQFPSRTTVPIASLPATSQTWIANHGKEFAAGKLSHNAWGGPIVLLIIAVLVALGVVNAGFGSRRLWNSSTQAQMAFFLVAAPMFLALGIRRVRRVAKSPFGKYTTIHPLHLIQVDVDKVTLWPLVNLHDVSLTHHSTNGVYQYTAVRMDFAGTICNLTIRGQQASVDWANGLLAQRRRVLELMSMGLLDAEEGYDMVPPEVLSGGPKKADPKAEADKKKALQFYGIFAAVGLLLAVIAIPYNKGAAERDAWQSCSRYPSINEYRSYLDKFPKGKHAAQAKEGIAAKYDEAIEKYKTKQRGADPKGLQAIIDVVTALKNSDTRRIKITYESSFDFTEVKGLDRSKYGDVTAPDTAFTPSYNKTRESSITSALRRAFHDMFSSDVVDFDDGGYSYSYNYSYATGRRKEEPSPVTFVVKYRISPSGSIYESTTGSKKKLFGILFDWDFKIKFEGETADRYAMQLASAPAKNIRYTTYGDYEANSEIIPYTKMAESSFEEFGQKLAGGFGVAIHKTPDYGSPPSGGLGTGRYNPPRYGSGAVGGSTGRPGMSPALQKALDDMQKNGRMSPETQKLLDDIRRMNKNK